MSTPTSAPDSHKWPVIDPADADLFLKGDPLLLEKILRLLHIKKSIVITLDLIIEEVGKDEWYVNEAAMVDRVRALMSESNEIVDYFRDHAPHMPVKCPQFDPFNFKQFVWRTVRDDLGVEYKRMKAELKEADQQGDVETAKGLLKQIEPLHEHMIRISEYMTVFYDGPTRLNINDYDLAIEY